MERTTILIDESDRIAASTIQAEFGLRSMGAAIRFALRVVSEQCRQSKGKSDENDFFPRRIRIDSER